MKVYFFYVHHYMDMRPELEFRLFASQEDADAYVQNLRKNWCSGTVSEAWCASKEEFVSTLKKYNWPDDEINDWLAKCSYEQ